MKELLLKALMKNPVSAVVTVAKGMATNELRYRASMLPMEAQIYAENKVKQSVKQSIEETKQLPQQLGHEFRRQSYHQNQIQPFQNNNAYFEQYYQQQQQRYTTAPQPNLAEILYIREQQNKKRH